MAFLTDKSELCKLENFTFKWFILLWVQIKEYPNRLTLNITHIMDFILNKEKEKRYLKMLISIKLKVFENVLQPMLYECVIM